MVREGLLTPIRVLAAAALGVALVGHAATAAPTWKRITGQHVVVFGTQPEGALRRMAVQLEQFHVVLGAMIGPGGPGTQPSAVPTPVYVFDRARAMQPFVPLHNGRPIEVAGYCHCGSDSREGFIVLRTTEWQGVTETVLHEYTHRVMGIALPAMPAWLNEGLAEYFSTFRVLSDGRRAEAGRALAHHVRLLREQSITVSELVADERTSTAYDDSQRRSVFYAAAWALTHYLLTEDPEGLGKITAYLNAVAAGSPLADAFAEHVGDAAALDKRLRSYVGRVAFKTQTFAVDERSRVAPPETAAALSDAEVAARLGRVQLSIGREDEAQSRIESAASEGGGAQAALSLGLLRLQQRRREEAWAPLEKAAALSPEDLSTQFAVAQALFAEVRPFAGDPPPPAAQKAAAEAAARAAALNPHSADVLALHALFEWTVSERLPEARAALARAIALAPGRRVYRLWLAEIYAGEGEFPTARRLLAELAVTAGGDSVAERARERLSRLDTIGWISAEYADRLAAEAKAKSAADR
jgi:tetratricopeptide (TPR) repeat protein